jgi:hypothetical protein
MFGELTKRLYVSVFTNLFGVECALFFYHYGNTMRVSGMWHTGNLVMALYCGGLICRRFGDSVSNNKRK